MERKRTGDDPKMCAPGALSDNEIIRCPDPNAPPPRIDDRLAPPETRVEYLHGGELYAAPADPPHAIERAEVSFVLRGLLGPGRRVGIDMLTRTDEASDFAPDASVFPADPDPVTGGRQIEELAFEVASEQSISVPTSKARELARRGVRRVFCVLVKQHRVLEWSREIDGWRTMPETEVIEDACLAAPVPVRALLDAAAADDAVGRGLIARATAAIVAYREEGRQEGQAEGRIEAARKCVAAGMPVERVAEILGLDPSVLGSR